MGHVQWIAQRVAAALGLELHQKVYKQDKYKCVEEQTSWGRAAIGSNPWAKESARQLVRLRVRHQKENEAALDAISRTRGSSATAGCALTKRHQKERTLLFVRHVSSRASLLPT